MSSDGPLPPSITPERGTSPRNKRPAGSSTATARDSAAAPTETGTVPVGRLGAFGRVQRVGETSADVDSVNGTETADPRASAPAGATRRPSAGGPVSTADWDERTPHEDDDLGAEGSAADVAAEVGSSDLGPRRVRLAISRVDPWSVMKLSFLLSVAIGIMIVVAAAVVWMTLDGLEVFASLNETITEIVGDESFINILEYVEFSRVLSLATFIAVIDVVLLTALGTIGAFLYNITAALVGGIHLTLTDE